MHEPVSRAVSERRPNPGGRVGTVCLAVSRPLSYLPSGREEALTDAAVTGAEVVEDLLS